MPSLELLPHENPLSVVPTSSATVQGRTEGTERPRRLQRTTRHSVWALPVLLGLAVFGLGQRGATAATLIWTGLEANDSITTTHWSPPQAPATVDIPDTLFTLDSLIFTASAWLNPTLADLLDEVSLTFDSTASAFSLGGTGIYTVGTGGIVNTRAANTNVPLGTASSWNTSLGHLSIAGTVNNNGQLLTITGHKVTTINGVISGNRSLTETGTGVSNQSGNNTYRGVGTINTGTLRLGSVDGEPASSTLSVCMPGEATFDLNNFNSGISSLAGVGNVASGSGTSIWPGPLPVSTVAADARQLTSSGTGILTLMGATRVTQGAVNVHNDDAFGAAGAGAAFAFDNTDGLNVDYNSLVLNDSGISGAGVIDSVPGNHSWEDAITLAPDLTIAVEADSFTVSDVIGESSGAWALVKARESTLILSSSNTFMDATTMSAAMPKICLSKRISDSPALSVASGASFDLYDLAETVGSGAGAGTLILDTSATADLSANGGDFTKAGASSDTGTTTASQNNPPVGSGDSGSTSTEAVTAANSSIVLGTGVLQGSTFTALNNSKIHAGDTTLTSGPGSVDFQSGSQIQPGTTTSNATWADSFTVTSSGTLTMSSTIRADASSFTPSQGQVFDFLDWSTLVTPSLSGFNVGTNFPNGSGDNSSQPDLPGISSSGFVWDGSSFTTSGLFVVALVPEPSRILLLGMALGAMILRRRRL